MSYYSTNNEPSHKAAPQPPAITAAELRDGMTIEHIGSGQRFKIYNVSPAPSGFQWSGKLDGGDGTEHNFNAPEDFAVRLVSAAQAAEREAQDMTHETFTAREQALIDLLWDYLKRDPEHRDRKQTGFGTKTQRGLVASIDRILKEHPAAPAAAIAEERKNWKEHGHHSTPLTIAEHTKHNYCSLCNDWFEPLVEGQQ